MLLSLERAELLVKASQKALSCEQLERQQQGWQAGAALWKL